MWLRAETDSRAFYPDELGHFNLHEASLLFGAVLFVEGPSLPPGLAPSPTVSSTAQSSGLGASASYNSTPQPPALKIGVKKKCRKRKRGAIMLEINLMLYYDGQADNA